MNTNKKNKFFLTLLQEKISMDNISIYNWIFFIFILFLGFLMIFSSHSLNSKVFKINQLKEEVNDLQSQLIQIYIKLMKSSLDSDLVK